jgi:biopolymer transport protein ExbB/TolQ
MTSGNRKKTKGILYTAALLAVSVFVTVSLSAQTSSPDPEGGEVKNASEVVSLENNGNNSEADLEQNGENGLWTSMKQGGALMILLVILAFISLTIIIERITYYTRNRVWDIKSMEEILRAVPSASKAGYREDIEDELRSVFTVYAGRIERGLALLSGVGNIAPIVGFLGTVLGMIQAFASIAAASTVNAKVVAVGIQIALTTTAGGLIVAAPTLIVFYLLSHLIQNRYARAEELISEIISDFPRLSETVENAGNGNR